MNLSLKLSEDAASDLGRQLLPGISWRIWCQMPQIPGIPPDWRNHTNRRTNKPSLGTMETIESLRTKPTCWHNRITHERKLHSRATSSEVKTFHREPITAQSQAPHPVRTSSADPRQTHREQEVTLCDPPPPYLQTNTVPGLHSWTLTHLEWANYYSATNISTQSLCLFLQILCYKTPVTPWDFASSTENLASWSFPHEINQFGHKTAQTYSDRSLWETFESQQWMRGFVGPKLDIYLEKWWICPLTRAQCRLLWRVRCKMSTNILSSEQGGEGHHTHSADVPRLSVASCPCAEKYTSVCSWTWAPISRLRAQTWWWPTQTEQNLQNGPKSKTCLVATAVICSDWLSRSLCRF